MLEWALPSGIFKYCILFIEIQRKGEWPHSLHSDHRLTAYDISVQNSSFKYEIN